MIFLVFFSLLTGWLPVACLLASISIYSYLSICLSIYEEQTTCEVFLISNKRYFKFCSSSS